VPDGVLPGGFLREGMRAAMSVDFEFAGVKRFYFAAPQFHADYDPVLSG
jgi:hypothetical protein